MFVVPDNVDAVIELGIVVCAAKVADILTLLANENPLDVAPSVAREGAVVVAEAFQIKASIYVPAFKTTGVGNAFVLIAFTVPFQMVPSSTVLVISV